MISHYKIMRKLGHGGMGDVYLAENTRLGLKVALKFLASELTRDPDAIKRLEHEARAVAELAHTNVSRINDIEEADGHRFLVLEYLEGETLSSHIQRGPLPIEETIRIGKALADGLAHAHKRGIVHRDIKPANIMLTFDNGVKIMDFGIARIADATRLTESGTRLGTITHMSPEQVSGNEADSRSDLWSVGVVLYQCLTGRQPFEGESAHVVLNRILADQPQPPTSLRTGVPIDLERVTLRCLEKDASLRYQHAEDLLAELRRLEKPSVSSVAVDSTVALSTSSENRPSGTRRWVVLLLVAILAVVAIWSVNKRPPSSDEPMSPEPAAVGVDPTRIVVLPFENLGHPEDAYFADGITEEITSRLARGGLSVISRMSALQYAGTDKTMQQIGQELGVGYVLEGTVRWAHEDEGPGRVRITPQLIRVSDDTHVWATTFDDVFDDIFETQSELARLVLQHVGLALAGGEQAGDNAKPTENLDAYRLYLRGLAHWNSLDIAFRADKNRLAILLFERAVELDPEFALAHAKLAEARSMLYRFGREGWETGLPLAKRAADRAVELAPNSPDAHQAVALYYYWGHRDYERALAAISVAIDLDPGSGEMLETRGSIQRRSGHWEVALADYERAFELDPRNGDIALYLGQAHRFLRRYQDAIRWFDVSVALVPDQVFAYEQKNLAYLAWKGRTVEVRQAIQDMPSDVPETWMYWFDVYDGDYEAALVRATSWVERADASFFRAQCLELLDRPSEARLAYEAELKRVEQVLNDAPDRWIDHYRRGAVLASLGRKEEAIQAGKRAFELLPPSKDAFAIDNMFSLVTIYTRVGEYDAAFDHMEFMLSHPSSYSLRRFQMSPVLAPLWELPRFREIEERYAVPESS